MDKEIQNSNVIKIRYRKLRIIYLCMSIFLVSTVAGIGIFVSFNILIGWQYTLLTIGAIALVVLLLIIGNMLLHRLVFLPGEREILEKVRMSADLIQSFLDSVPQDIEIFDDEFNLIYCNEQVLKRIGVNSKDEYTARFMEFFPQFQPSGERSDVKYRRLMTKALEEGYVNERWLSITNFGESLPLNITLSRINRDGKRMIICTGIDLRPIENSEEVTVRIQNILNVAPISVTIYSSSRKMIDCNDEAVRLFKFSDKDELINAFNSRMFTLMPAVQPCGTQSNRKVPWLFNEVEKRGSHILEWPHTTNDGEVFPAELYMAKIDQNDDFIFVVYLRDLRKERKAQADLIEATKYSSMLLESAPMFIEIWDSNGNMIDCNDSVCYLLELSDRSEFITNRRNYSPFLQPCGTTSDDKVKQLVDTAIKKGSSRSEWIHLNSKGNEVAVEVIYMRLKRKSDVIVVGYNYDLRPVKLLDKQRIDALEEANQAKTRFLARMSHEIRSPMNAVLGITESLLHRADMQDDVIEALGRIFSSSNLLLYIINDILDFSKIESGNMEIVLRQYETVSLIVDTTQLNAMHIGDKNITFALSVDNNLPQRLIGDEHRIKQILNNLLSNSFKYTEKGTISLDVKWRGDSLVFTVKDTGMGMTEEQLKRLGDEYMRFSDADNRIIQGTGLGISIVNHLVNQMGGDITVSSVVDKGTIFTVSLPQKKTDDDVIGAETKKRLEEFDIKTDFRNSYRRYVQSADSRGSILVVDDLESNLYVAVELLKAYKVNVDTAISGTAALRKIDNGNVYDLILMDHMMPDIDGIETTKRIREKGYDKPIVALTANIVGDMSDKFLSSGFQDILIKPIDVNQFDNCISTYISNVVRNDVPDDNNYVVTTIAEIDFADPLINSILQDMSKAYDIISNITSKTSLDESDISAFTRQAHSLKGILPILGEGELADVAYSLEKAGSNGDVDIIIDASAEFLNDIRSIIDSLNDKKSKDTSPHTDSDKIFLLKQLAEIADACDTYEVGKVQLLLAAFREKPWSSRTLSVISDIEMQILQSDFALAAANAREYVESYDD